jgi:hypothetical protein
MTGCGDGGMRRLSTANSRVQAGIHAVKQVDIGLYGKCTEQPSASTKNRYQTIPNIRITTGVSAASKIIVPMAPQIDVWVLCVMKMPPIFRKHFNVNGNKPLSLSVYDLRPSSDQLPEIASEIL